MCCAVLFPALLARASGSNMDIGCGGFVRALDSIGGAKPDMLPVRVRLIALDGTVKAETECAPNGYFYLPMYDPGAYVVRLEAPPVRGSLGVSARALEARRSLCVYARLIVRGVRVSVAACTDAVAPTRDEVAWKGA